jgi:hypothetical protein
MNRKIADLCDGYVHHRRLFLDWLTAGTGAALFTRLA